MEEEQEEEEEEEELVSVFRVYFGRQWQLLTPTSRN